MRQSTKYGEIIDYVHRLIEEKKLHPGGSLPSITEISRTLSVARETVVKSYKILKQEGLIDSVPGKGFYLLTDRINHSSRILLILNSFNPYMQVLYNAFSGALPDNATADVYFHHNSMSHFGDLLTSYSRRYTHFIIKPPQGEGLPELLGGLEPRRTLILDRGEYRPEGCSLLCQDFSAGFSQALVQIRDRFKGYSSLNMIRSGANPHPEDSFDAFSAFLENQSLKGAVLTGFSEDLIQKGGAYIVLSEQDLVSLLTLIAARGWQPGKDIGILSYNDFPLLEFVSGGITSLSVDFREMGEKAAAFAGGNGIISETLKPRMILRSSL